MTGTVCDGQCVYGVSVRGSVFMVCVTGSTVLCYFVPG